MKNKTWLLIFAAVAVVTGIAICSLTAYVDPYMHFHKPLTDRFFYSVNNQRSQNDGIIKNFDYDTIITGSSMTENFRTSEADRIFECNSIKVPFAGATFKELNDNLLKGLSTHPNIKYIFCALDRYRFVSDKDSMRLELGEYPTYLYDSNPFNDIKYLMNRDVLYSRVCYMVRNAVVGAPAGITSFDESYNWMAGYTFGPESVGKKTFECASEETNLTEQEKQLIKGNVEQNITSLAEKYPNTQFYFFLPPYSAVYWGDLKQNGTMEEQLQTEEYALSLIVGHENIHMFGWARFDLTDDLNNYKDPTHYGEWVNSWVLAQMREESGRLTEDNYKSYIEKMRDHYTSFDFNSLFEQCDYEADYYASGLLNREIFGTQPLVIDNEFAKKAELKNANTVLGQFDGADGIECCAGMPADGSSGDPSLPDGNYSGMKFKIDASNFRALTFYGKKTAGAGNPTINIYGKDGKLISSTAYADPNGEWHQYAVNLSGIYGEVTVVMMNGGKSADADPQESACVFSKIILY